MTLQPPTNSSIKTTQYASICSKKCEKNIDLKHKHQQKHGGSDFVIRDALFLVYRYFSVLNSTQLNSTQPEITDAGV